MKLTQKLLGLSVVMAASITAASAASLTVYSGSPVNLGSSAADVPFVLSKFDPTLGTLTGVTVKVTSSALVGSFDVTNSGLNPLFVGPHTATFRVRDVSSTLGYGSSTTEIDMLGTSPSSAPVAATVPIGSSQTFDINLLQGYAVSDKTISSGSFAAYTGTGDVTFQVRNLINISASGSIYSVDSSNAYTTTQMAVTYTYDAVPEPSAALLGGLGLLVLVRRRR